jgi:carboxylesterase type B
VDKWEETLDATTFGAACPQFIYEMMADFAPPKMSEDCLFINVYVPLGVDLNSNLPVPLCDITRLKRPLFDGMRE